MIGVCIKYFHENYGGMLQALATTSLLEERCIAYELIQYEKKFTPAAAIRSVPRLFNNVLLDDKFQVLEKKVGKLRHPDFAANDAMRKEAFRSFREAHFRCLSPVFVGYEELCEGADRYSAVITGSDQLWSPAGLPTNFYNLMFVPDNIRKISYASSFGVSNIPWYQKRRTAAFLNRIDFISMREMRGSSIVWELTGREVPTVLDPVLMLDQRDWERLVPSTKVDEEPYILAYFLGRNVEYREAVTIAAHALGCKIVALRHLDQYVPEDEDFGDYAPYDVGPDDFLNMLRGAEFVCTDSFHGTCFSAIHEKSFVVFNRYKNSSGHSKNSRIDSLCQLLGLESHRYQGGDLAVQLLSNTDYGSARNSWNQARVRSTAYLDVALEGVC